MKDFFDRVNKVLVGGLTGVIIFFFSIIFWIFPANTQIPLWVIPIITIVFYLFIVIIYAFLKNPNKEIFRLPTVKRIVERNSNITLILEKNELYSINSVVSIYYEDEIQNLIGLGIVETINDKGNMQIKFLKVLDKSNLKGKLIDSAKNRNALKVKPTISIDFLEGEQTWDKK